ncbi:DotU family type IV/VI secretion system protein, partial [bacterium]|nr:DotU family type IV/VI secretion system protein [bacterium]
MSLGFRGKYLGVNDDGAIENYKKQIYAFIFQKSPNLSSEFKQLFPETYLHTIEKEAKAVIPGLKKWYIFVALLIITILGISHIIWANMTGDISKIIEQILA